MEEELTETEKGLLDNLDREHQDVLNKTDPNRILEALLQRVPAFSPEEIQSIIEESGIVEKIIALYKEHSSKMNGVLLFRQAMEGIHSEQEHLWYLAAFQASVVEYIHAALPRRLYYQIPLVLSEAVSCASSEHKTTSEQQKLEHLISDRGRFPHLPLRDPRGRKAVITDESLLHAFQEKGSFASMRAVAEILKVSTDALKKWRQDDHRNFKSWKDVQQYFAQGEK